MPVLSSVVTQGPASFRGVQAPAALSNIATLADGQVLQNMAGMLTGNALSALAQEVLGVLPAPPTAPAAGLFGAGAAGGLLPGLGGFGLGGFGLGGFGLGGFPGLLGFPGLAGGLFPGFPVPGAAPAFNAPAIAFNSVFGAFVNSLVNRLSNTANAAAYQNLVNSAVLNNTGNLALLWTWY